MTYLLKLNLHHYYARAMGSPNPHATLALSLARWLNKVAETLSGRSLAFEASEAESLAEEFRVFGEDDGSADDFIKLWQDLECWGERDISTDRREQALCSIPPLPEPLEC